MSPKVDDDKSSHCIPFILHHLTTHLTTNPSTPFIIGLNGIQGAGKTTLVTILSKHLLQLHNLTTLVLSIDDFYLPYSLQHQLASLHPSNALIQHRGEPGTHDMELLRSFFDDVREGRETWAPVYDKSARGGKGDRAPRDRWIPVNRAGEKPVKLVIFEGWCVGFRSLPSSTLSILHSSATTKTLQKHKLEDLEFVNGELRRYERIWEFFGIFIHIDAEELDWVYEWREEAEERVRRAKGAGMAMSKEEVVRFVDGYFPAYELFTEGVREGLFKGDGEKGVGRQLALVVGKDRRVKRVAVF